MWRDEKKKKDSSETQPKVRKDYWDSAGNERAGGFFTPSLLNHAGNKNSSLSDEWAGSDLAFRPLTISLARPSVLQKLCPGQSKITVDFYCGTKEKGTKQLRKRDGRWFFKALRLEVWCFTLAPERFLLNVLNGAQNATPFVFGLIDQPTQNECQHIVQNAAFSL